MGEEGGGAEAGSSNFKGSFALKIAPNPKQQYLPVR